MSRTGTGCRRNIDACAHVSAFAEAKWGDLGVYADKIIVCLSKGANTEILVCYEVALCCNVLNVLNRNNFRARKRSFECICCYNVQRFTSIFERRLRFSNLKTTRGYSAPE